MPDELVAPELRDVEWHFWGAFWDLTSERQVGTAAGPIPWSAIREYHRDFPVAGWSDFLAVMRAMDATFLASQGGETGETAVEIIKGRKAGTQ